VSAGDAVLPASGTIGAKPPIERVPKPSTIPTLPPSVVSALTVTPSTIAPGVAGAGTQATVAFTLAKAAFTTVRVTNTTGTQTLLTLASKTLPAGPSTFVWDAGALRDGRYRIVVAAKPAGAVETSRTAEAVVVRLLTNLVPSPTIFSPNGDGVADALTVGFTLAQPAWVQVVAQRAGAIVGTVYSGQLAAGSHSIGWDGSSGGVRLPDGEVVLVVTATNGLGAVSLLATVWIEGAPIPSPPAPAPAVTTPPAEPAP
jgi:hypothetical protein